MVTVTLYTSPQCGLCEEVKAALQQLASTYPHALVEVDITQDAMLLSRYRTAIPVVEVADRTLMAPIQAGELAAALRAAV